MKISELKSGQGKIDVEGTVTKIGNVRTFNKFGKDSRVANATLTSEGESITLSLWNDEIDKVKEGSVVRVTNGYVSEFNGSKQLSAGKYGKLDVIGGDSGGSEESDAPAKKRSKNEKSEEAAEEDYF